MIMTRETGLFCLAFRTDWYNFPQGQLSCCGLSRLTVKPLSIDHTVGWGTRGISNGGEERRDRRVQDSSTFSII